MARRIPIRYEQAVYGSFPFWDRGYAILAHSPGCRPEWLAGLRAACQRFGERPAGAAEARGLFALRLERGPWMIVGVGPQGHDDRGRPGALAFHALFVDPRGYRKAGGIPFDFAAALRNDWTAETRTLATGTLLVDPPAEGGPPADRRAGRIAAVLARGGRVALQASEPIDALAREAWLALPLAVRSRASVATWAFGNANRFDLVALPRLAGVELDPSYLPPEALETETGAAGLPPPGEPPSRGRITRSLGPRPLGRAWLGLGAAVVLLGLGAGMTWALRPGGAGEAAPSPAATASPPRTTPAFEDRAPPDPADYAGDDPGPEERRRVAEGLVDLAERFGVLDAAAGGHADPSALMARLAERLRYRGPWLSAAELAGLTREEATGAPSSRDRALALRWHAQVRRFAPDRPLPEGFADGPLRWQLDTLAWSFHLGDDGDARLRSPAEVVHALADALAVDVPLRETALAAHSPALAAYREFLGRLPRR